MGQGKGRDPSGSAPFPGGRLYALEAGYVAYGAARVVEPLALPARRLAARPLPHILGLDAVAGLAAGVVVVDLRVSRVPRALPLKAPVVCLTAFRAALAIPCRCP